MATYGYDKKTDYTKLINEAVAAGDYRTAAIREAQRNEKVRGENLTQYQTTNHYADYLPKTERINSGMDKLAQGSQWKYELEQDPAWQAMRKQYLREADRGTRDTMAAAASMTGGVPSTAAVQAGQQAGNYYRAQLSDRIPELMQNDYSRYLQGREADRADLSLLQDIENQRAAESLGLQQWAWQKEGDLWSRGMDEEQWAWQKEQAQLDREYQQKNQIWQQAMTRWETLGYADQAVADALGVPVGTATGDAAYRQKQLEYQQWQKEQSELSAQRDQEYREWQMRQAEASAAQDQDYRTWQQGQTERSDAYSRALTQINMGIVPDAATLAAAGLDEATARSMVAKVLQQLVQGNYTGSGSSGSGSKSGAGSGSGGGSSSTGSGSGSGTASGNGGTEGGSSWGPGVDATTYNGVRQTIYYAKQSNNRQAAVNAMEGVADQLSERQYNDLIAYLEQLFPGENKQNKTQDSGYWDRLWRSVKNAGGLLE